MKKYVNIDKNNKIRARRPSLPCLIFLNKLHKATLKMHFIVIKLYLYLSKTYFAYSNENIEISIECNFDNVSHFKVFYILKIYD